jgi:hypothetical protein
MSTPPRSRTADDLPTVVGGPQVALHKDNLTVLLLDERCDLEAEKAGEQTVESARKNA